MGVFFEAFAPDRCCLCGAVAGLTGEHKVKASALRAIFGSDEMAIGYFGGESNPRPAQGPKSREFHFGARMCHACNTRRTQAADREFDRLRKLADEAMARGGGPGSVFELERYQTGSAAYLNVFRYFAKLMCCHLADSGGPRPIHVARFALGEIDHNPICLHIDADPTYADYSALTGEHQYAAHGGLVASTDRKTGLLTGFRTSLTLGPVRYLFFIEFGRAIALEIMLWHRPFAAKCAAAYRAALQEPISLELRRKLGL